VADRVGRVCGGMKFHPAGFGIEWVFSEEGSFGGLNVRYNVWVRLALDSEGFMFAPDPNSSFPDRYLHPLPPGYGVSPARMGRLLEEQGRLPLLICGVAGVAGYNGLLHFQKKYPGLVFGQRAAQTWRLKREGVYGCDSDDAESLSRMIEEIRPRSIWNCGGSCALKACELDPDLAFRVNVDGVQNLLDCVRGRDIRFLHFSIDLVFSGSGQGLYVETDRVDPVTVYGKTMVEAENRVLDQCPDACVVRISLPMGISFNGHAGAVDWIQSRFAKERPATLYLDEVRTPTYVGCLNEVAEELLAGEWSGLYHGGGPRHLSLFQIAQIVNRIGGYDPVHLEGCPRIEAGPMPPRAGNVTMNSDKLSRALGRQPFIPWPLDGSFVPRDERWHFERNEPGSAHLLSGCLYDRPLIP